ncbi:FecR family protein [Elstera litoralis]|uniref:FecR family protein n=1 Tax=Elstera litoralis TaxID=552518 RepID=UPI0006983B6C|nr:FecR family protein [Elstera litoralis]
MRIGLHSLMMTVLAGTAFSALAVDADAKIVGRAAVIQDIVRGRTTPTDERVIKLNDILVFQEQVVTGPKSKAIIEFRDGTTLELGPNGALTLDKMVFDPEGGKKDKAVSISRGLFRLVSGAAAPDSTTTIKTPSGTIGIRGSLVAGVVPSDPNQSTVIVGGSGNFTHTSNNGTTTQFTGGQSVISNPTGNTVPPNQVPANTTLSVINQVGNTLGQQPPTLPSAPTNVQQQLAAANTVPANQQTQQQTSTSAPLPPPPATGSVGLASGVQTTASNTPATAQQQQQINNYTQQQQQVNNQQQQQATQNVVQGLSTVMNPTQLANAVTQISNGNPAQSQTAQNASGLSQQLIAQAPAAMPPALQAAINSGNAAAVTQAINTLSAGNPQRAATLAQQAVAAAERLLATNPQAAVAVAGATMQIVAQLSVQSSAPPQVLQTLTTAARIFVSPAAQRLAPQQAGNLAVQAAQIASSPTIYSANPQAAIQVMANAYQTATSTAVLAASPFVAAQVTQILSQASAAQTLGQANPTNTSQIAQILGSNTPNLPTTVREEGATGVQNPSETPLKTENERQFASPT